MDSNSFDRTTRSLAGTTSRRQALKMLGGGLLGGALAGAGFATAKDAVAQTGIPVTGTSTLGDFSGTISNLLATLNEATGNIDITGNIVGEITDAGGTLVQAVNDTFTAVLNLPTSGSGGRCDILFLDLGPLDLDLLGLEIDLSQITLDIDAVPGNGNLLGNLLCAVAGLLDRGGPVSGLLRNLNRVFDLIG